MITLKVYGSLRTAMGGIAEHKYDKCYDVRTLIQAMTSNFKSIQKYLSDRSDMPFQILVNGTKYLTKDTIKTTKFKDGDSIQFIPVIGGSGDNWGSVATIIIAIIIIVIAWWNPAFLGLSKEVVAGMYAMGGSMLMSGISQLLFKPEEVEPSTYEADDKSKSNYAFNGPVNLTSQGNAVPIGYGKLRVGSQVIAAGLFAQNI